MKKIILLCFSLFFLIGNLIVPKEFAHAAHTSATEQELANAIDNMAYAFKNTDLKLNLEDPDSNIVEENVYDKNGEFLGTFGMEIVSDENGNGNQVVRMSLPGNKKAFSGTTTVKVYWYAASINYQFYAKIAKNSSGKAYISSVYDENYFVIPPVVVSSDKLEIIQKTETSSSPAQARYTLNLSTYVGGSTKLWIFVKAAKGYFWTGGN